MRWVRCLSILLLVGAVGAAAVAAARAKTPELIRRRLTGAVVSRCESCHLELGTIRVTLLPATITLERPHLTGGDPRATGVDVQAERVTLSLAVLPLLLRHVHLNSVVVESPKVVVTEGDGKTPHPLDDGPALGSTKAYLLQKTTLTGGEFTYLRVHAGQRARIHVTNIEGSVEEFGTIGALRQQTAKARVTGRLERSGKFWLVVGMPLFTPGFHLDIDLRVVGQPLAELNPFFEIDDGVKLSGVLKEGHGTVAIRHRTLDGTVAVKYSGLNFHFESSEARSGLSALLSNLGNNFTSSSSEDRKPRDQLRSVELERAEGMPIFKFIFRGLKLAAFRVVKNQ